MNAQHRTHPLLKPATFLLLLSMLAFGAAQAHAKKDRDGGGYAGPGVTVQGGYTGPGPDLVTVQQALSMSDDARVALKGNITKSLGGKDYVFTDSTGSINVEIGRKAWQGQEIGPNDLAEIHGKVDKDWNSTEIDVKRLIRR